MREPTEIRVRQCVERHIDYGAVGYAVTARSWMSDEEALGAPGVPRAGDTITLAGWWKKLGPQKVHYVELEPWRWPRGSPHPGAVCRRVVRAYLEGW